jgi:hypothetical protein
MKDLWQSHDYSGNFCFPKDGIILWQFREKDEDKRREFSLLINTRAALGGCQPGNAAPEKDRTRGRCKLSMRGRRIMSLAEAMSGSGFLPEKMTTLAFSSATGPTEES